MKPSTVLYATVVFFSAFLLFLLEPIVARQLLPLFGGSAAVWITCLVFFQCALFAGYGYAHQLVSRLPPKPQAGLHAAILTASVLVLLVRVRPGHGAAASHPARSILLLLTTTIGLPFLALAATSPLLQAWFARSNARQKAPWWFFALSNAGSLLALLAYPVLIEPASTLRSQTDGWGIGFCAFAAMCGALALQSRRTNPAIAVRPPETLQLDTGSAQRLLWMLLPATSSMLLCAVTNHLGENIASIPLLWIVPLTMYLLSFVITFASPRAWPRFIAVRMMVLTLATFAYLIYTGRSVLVPEASIPVYTLALFFACLYCHSELYRLRPAAGEVTNYYLLISLGSAIGAILVGVIAPNIFHANYDLACAVVLLAATALAANWRQGLVPRFIWAGTTVGLVYIGVFQAKVLSQDAVVQLRSFYGSLRVTETHLPPIAETTRTLYHGRIQHGTQLFGNGLRTQPSSYYPHSSGVGLALDLCCEDHAKRVGVVGLGTGTLAVYGKPGDDFTFYEIDPLVERLARALFTYLHDSPATIHVVPGDARLSIAREVARLGTSEPYDVLVLDAFTGDAIPVHLLTAQAIQLYRLRLRPDGVIVFHISSQYIDLAPELALQASNAGLQCVVVHTDADEARGIFSADWLLMSANEVFLKRPEVANVAQPPLVMTGLRLWTDDYSSLLPLLKWRGGASLAPKP
jgi:hypothetical protein